MKKRGLEDEKSTKPGHYVEVFGVSIDETRKIENPRWSVFLEELARAGFWEIAAPTALFIDLNPSLYSLVKLHKLRNHFKVLVQVEPRTVNPMQFHPRVFRAFDVVISEAGLKEYAPADYWWQAGFDLQLKNRHPKGMAVFDVGALIGRKFSFDMLSQYSRRNKVLTELSLSGLRVSYGGRGWGSSVSALKALLVASFLKIVFAQGAPTPLEVMNALRKPKATYLGEFSNEADFFQKIAVALVIENEKGHLSEKMFEALATNTPVIYSGQELPDLEHVLPLMNPLDIGRIRDFIEESKRNSVDAASSLGLLSDHVPSLRESFESLARMIVSLKNTKD